MGLVGESERQMRSSNPAGAGRLHHLDAVRAFAMLLGVALHTALSYFDSGWAVRDGSGADSGFYLFFVLTIHAFRMPLFFLLSGFFAALLTGKRAIRAVLEHRFRRLLVPLVLGAVTIVPLTTLAGSASTRSTIWDAVIANSPELIAEQIDDGADPNLLGKQHSTPLHLAAVLGNDAAIRGLVIGGADLTIPNSDGSTPLVAAIWAGNSHTADALAEFMKANGEAASMGPLASIEDWHRLEWFGAGAGVASGILDAVAPSTSDPGGSPDIQPWNTGLHHLWFLWHLFIITIAYLILAAVGRKAATGVRFPARLTLAVIVGATFAMQTTMSGFGPDTSTSVIPAWHVLGYYALFFAAGVVLRQTGGWRGRAGMEWFGAWWIVAWAIGLPVVLPLALATAPGEHNEQLASQFLQAAFAWLALIGMIGLTERVLSAPKAWVRWLSDSSYWIYLAHLPLVLLGQRLARGVELPSGIEFIAINLVVGGGLFVVYRHAIRPGPIGRLLNGPLPRRVQL